MLVTSLFRRYSVVGPQTTNHNNLCLFVNYLHWIYRTWHFTFELYIIAPQSDQFLIIFENFFCRIYFLSNDTCFINSILVSVTLQLILTILPSVTFLWVPESRIGATSRNFLMITLSWHQKTQTPRTKASNSKQQKLIGCTMWPLLHTKETGTSFDVQLIHAMYLLFLRELFSFQWSILGTGKLNLSTL